MIRSDLSGISVDSISRAWCRVAESCMKTHRHDLSNSLCVVVHSLLWLAHGCNLLNASASWLEPVLSLFHWEPDIGTGVAFVLKVERNIKVVLSVWEEIS